MIDASIYMNFFPPKLFPVILFICEQTSVWLDNDFHYEPAIIYCYYTLLLSNNCQLSRSVCSPKLRLQNVSKAFHGNGPSLCTEVCNPHVDTLVIYVFIFQTSCFKKRRLGFSAAIKGDGGDSHAAHGLAPWFPEAALLLPPPPPHPFTSSNLTASCDSGGLHALSPNRHKPTAQGSNTFLPAHMWFCGGRATLWSPCLSVPVRQTRFTAQQDDSPSSFPKVIFIAPDLIGNED